MRSFVLFFLFLFSSCRLLEHKSGENGVTWIIFDVGQGLATCGYDNSLQAICVDVGSSKGGWARQLSETPIRSIHTLILSHPDLDHVGGILELPDSLRPQRVLVPQGFSSRLYDSSSVDLMRVFTLLGKWSVDTIAEGDSIVGPGDIRFLTLWPPRNFAITETNEGSLVLRGGFESWNILFTGDIDSTIENKLVYGAQPLRSEVLVVGHHGSKYSSSLFFLQKVLPTIALISADVHVYGHPHPEVMDKLHRIGLSDQKILNTDVQGSLYIREKNGTLIW